MIFYKWLQNYEFILKMPNNERVGALEVRDLKGLDGILLCVDAILRCGMDTKKGRPRSSYIYNEWLFYDVVAVGHLSYLFDDVSFELVVLKDVDVFVKSEHKASDAFEATNFYVQSIVFVA